MAKNRREIEMALKVIITVMTAILEMLENVDYAPKEVLEAGKEGVR